MDYVVQRNPTTMVHGQSFLAKMRANTCFRDITLKQKIEVFPWHRNMTWILLYFSSKFMERLKYCLLVESAKNVLPPTHIIPLLAHIWSSTFDLYCISWDKVAVNQHFCSYVLRGNTYLIKRILLSKSFMFYFVLLFAKWKNNSSSYLTNELLLITSDYITSCLSKWITLSKW